MSGPSLPAAASGGSDHTGDGHPLWQAATSLFALRESGRVLQRIVEVGRILGRADAGIVLVSDPQTGEFRPSVPSVALGLDECWLRRGGLEEAQALIQTPTGCLRFPARDETLNLPADQVLVLDLDGAMMGKRSRRARSSSPWPGRGEPLRLRDDGR